jgi:hypothetical protein
MDTPVKIGGGGAGAEAAAASAAKAEEERTAPLDTTGVSDGIADSIREAEAVEAYGVGEPADADASSGGDASKARGDA